MKFLRVTMANGEIWDIELSHIAMNRAMYYANHDHLYRVEPGSKWKKIFNCEYELTINNPVFAIEWASGNMDWSDVAVWAVRVKQPEFDYQDGWINGKKEIIEKD